MLCGYPGPEEKGEGAASKGSGIEQEGEGTLHMTHASTSSFQFRLNTTQSRLLR